MQPAAVDDAARRGVRLIVSVDNGIRAVAAIERARELGIDVIVTDHHLPETELPPALAIINPSRAIAVIRIRTCAARAWRSNWRMRFWRARDGRRRGFIACSNRF